MLSTKRLSFSRSGRELFSGLDLSFQTNEFAVILGPNGVGKTTLLNILSGFIDPDEGVVSLSGSAINNLNDHERSQQIAMLGQFNQLAFDFNVIEVLEMAMLSHSKSLLDQVCTALDLTSSLSKRMGQLSGGEQQRVHWGRVLLQSLDAQTQLDQYLLLDEPIAHMDIRYQHQCLRYLKGILGPKRGAVAVLHDIHLAFSVADRILILGYEGLLFDGKVSDPKISDCLSDAYAVKLILNEAGSLDVVPFES